MMKSGNVRKDARSVLTFVVIVIVLAVVITGFRAVPSQDWKSFGESVGFGLGAIVNEGASLVILAPLAFVFWLGFSLMKDVEKINVLSVAIAAVLTVIVFHFAPHVSWLFVLGAGVSWGTQRWTHADMKKAGIWATVVCVLAPHLFATALLLPQELPLLRDQGSAISLVKDRDDILHTWGFRGWGLRWWQSDSSYKTEGVMGAYVFYPLEFFSPRPPTKIYSGSIVTPSDPADDYHY